MDPLSQAIEDAWEAAPKERPRRYIGASSVGNPCDALLAFSLRGFPDTPPPAFLRRIFRDGHRIENEVIRDLRKAGFLVWEKDATTGRQFEYQTFGRHIVCHCDGQIEITKLWPEWEGEVGLLEIKSMNDNSWAKFVDLGVRTSHPVYYWQMQMMMGLSGFRVCVFLAYNKNNSRYHAEVVGFRPTDYSYLSMRIQTALSNNARKISEDEADWRCRSCFKRDACWHGLAPERACHTCAHAAADPDHEWHCMKHDMPCVAVCGDYEIYHPLPKL